MSQYDLLNPKRSCLFVIDHQERLMAAIEKAEKVVAKTRLMIHCAKTLDIPIIATTQYKKGLGPFVPELAELLEGVSEIEKMEFNALANPQVRTEIFGLPSAIDTIIITGVEAHICVNQTAIGVLNTGYHPWIVSDAVSSRDKKNAKAALKRLQSLGIPVGPAEMAVYELLGKAGTPEFKTMLPHLK